MLKILGTNLKHFFITFTILFILTVIFGIYIGADAHLQEDPLAYKLDKEGPHIFFENETVVVNHIRGGKKQGFYTEKKIYQSDQKFTTSAFFTLEQQEFSFDVNPEISIPKSVYQDTNPIIAISDIESGFKTFRDFLIANKVIDEQLNWSFGKGHLVLVGDFVDRGASVTQVLWFIYKLEQEALLNGGKVHFIIGNHEIKNLQGDYKKASFKYFHIASMIGKQQYDLYGPNSFIGRWLSSKNSLEIINGHLFVHGGIHPKISEFNYSIEEINQIIRNNYRLAYFPKPESSNQQFLVSTKTGPAWYRGYFKDELSQKEIEKGLETFAASDVVVGHNPQWSIKKLYNGKVYAIDVKHPRDYRSSFPPRSSEGLLIEGSNFYRLLDDGTKEKL